MNHTFLFGLTSFFNLLFLICALWLGLFILLHSSRDKTTWLLSLTLWSLAGYFLNTLTCLHALPSGGSLPWWWGWSVASAVPFWYHLSVSLLPRQAAQMQHTPVLLGYLLGLNLIAMEAYTPLVFQGTGEVASIYYSYQIPGPLFPLYGIYLVVFPALSLWNFRREWSESTRQPPQRHNVQLQIASVLAVVGGAYSGTSIWLEWDAPIIFTTLLLGLGVLLLFYGVAQRDAPFTRIIHRRDFVYSTVVIGLIVAGYALVALLSDLVFHVPFIAYIFLICFAMITHSLYDFSLGFLDGYFSHRREHKQLRATLRGLTRSGDFMHDIHESVRTLLRSLCVVLGIRRGWITFEGEERFVAWAPDVGQDEPPAIAEPRESSNGVVAFAVGANTGGGELITVALLHGGVSLGKIILELQPGGRVCTDDELDLIEDFAVRVAEMLYTVSLQRETISQFEEMMQRMNQREKELQAQIRQAVVSTSSFFEVESWDDTEFGELVEDALRHLGDYSYLGDHRLARLKAVSTHLKDDDMTQVTHLDRGRALHALITGCIEKIRPSGSLAIPPARDWYPFIVLQDCYVEGKKTSDVMAGLYVSEATFHRIRRRAVRGLAKAISEIEENAGRAEQDLG